MKQTNKFELVYDKACKLLLLLNLELERFEDDKWDNTWIILKPNVEDFLIFFSIQLFIHIYIIDCFYISHINLPQSYFTIRKDYSNIYHIFNYVCIVIKF